MTLSLLYCLLHFVSLSVFYVIFLALWFLHLVCTALNLLVPNTLFFALSFFFLLFLSFHLFFSLLHPFFLLFFFFLFVLRKKKRKKKGIEKAAVPQSLSGICVIKSCRLCCCCCCLLDGPKPNLSSSDWHNKTSYDFGCFFGCW